MELLEPTAREVVDKHFFLALTLFGVLLGLIHVLFSLDQGPKNKYLYSSGRLYKLQGKISRHAVPFVFLEHIYSRGIPWHCCNVDQAGMAIEGKLVIFT